MKKRLKSIFVICLLVYAGNFLVDYVVVRTHDGVDERFCQHWFKTVPLWAQLLAMPGTSNACLDKGFLPRRDP